jgi:hypothetical protein
MYLFIYEIYKHMYHLSNEVVIHEIVNIIILCNAFIYESMSLIYAILQQRKGEND